MKKLVLVLVFLAIASCGFAQGGDRENTYVDMSNPYTTDDTLLQEAARKEGIPESEMKIYVTRAKELNLAYQAGSLTKNEYVQQKRELIQYCK